MRRYYLQMGALGLAVVVEAWRLEITEIRRRIALGFFTLKALMLCPPHAIVMRLQGYDVSYVVTLSPETANLLGLQEAR